MEKKGRKRQVLHEMMISDKLESMDFIIIKKSLKKCLAAQFKNDTCQSRIPNFIIIKSLFHIFGASLSLPLYPLPDFTFIQHCIPL